MIVKNNLQRLKKRGIKLSLDRILKILPYFNNPESGMRTIIVGGTNGKGSVSSYLAHILKFANINTGLFTSPYLVKVNEMIKCNLVQISDLELNEILNDIIKIDEEKKIELTLFEVLTLSALIYFREKKCEICILEVGMGGKNDATNVVHPNFAILTNIDYDHTNFFGYNLENICLEKIGIIKEKTLVVTSISKYLLLKYLIPHVKNMKSKLYYFNPLETLDNYIKDLCVPYLKISDSSLIFGNLSIKPILEGYHQLINAGLAIITAKELEISDKHIKMGIENTICPGRLEIISKNPYLILDVAHNEASFKVQYDFLKKIDSNWTFFMTLKKDKNLISILNLVSNLAQKIFWIDFEEEFYSYKDVIKVFSNYENIKSKISKIRKKDFLKNLNKLKLENKNIIITGSHRIVGEYLLQNNF